MIDLEKRRRIMARSIKLGHCICNPRQSCPCEPFKSRDVCQCAGERLDDAAGEVALTTLVENAGCASKIGQADLKRALAGLPETTDPRVLVGAGAYDDAGVFRIGPDTALVQTVDVFTPIVDDPYVYGQIAAANAVSDVYAMGGTPLTALSIISFPIETLSPSIMHRILRGGMDKLAEAGVVVLGGHSLKGSEIKFGFAVTGTVPPERIVTNAGGRPGDALVLTKPLGTGTIGFAQQLGKASAAAKEAAAASMVELNRDAARVMIEIGVRAATDVTGFGLAGHLAEMASQSGVGAEIYADRLPVLPDVLDSLRAGLVCGGIERNLESASESVDVESGVPEELATLLYDPQTSGGLLMAVPRAAADDCVARLKAAGILSAAVIGRFVEGPKGRIMVKKSAPAGHPESASPAAKPSAPRREPASCCAGGPPAEPVTSASSLPDPDRTPETQALFSDFMSGAANGGAVPARTKELMSLALAFLSRCEPCVAAHVEKARSLGIGDEEIAEALWLAVSFGGAPVLTFYKALREKS